MTRPVLRQRLDALLASGQLGPLAGLTLAIGISWLWLAPMALDMNGAMAGAARWMMAPAWDARYALLVFLMWAVMMVGMMLPSAAPMVLMFARVARAAPGGAGASWFVSGYVAAWTGFSVLATLLQWALSRAGALSSMMQSQSVLLDAALLIAAGVYQWTSLKQICLTHCRSPAHTLTALWRRGRGGALRMGFVHGLFCIGCCWAAMALLFVGGVMNLAWILLISLFVLAEKAFPGGARLGRVTAPALLAAGAWLALSAGSQSAIPG